MTINVNCNDEDDEAMMMQITNGKLGTIVISWVHFNLLQRSQSTTVLI